LENQALLVNNRRETVESGSFCLSMKVMSLIRVQLGELNK